MNNKKKIIIICSMVVLLIAAGYLNVMLNRNSDPINPVNNPENSTPVSFFAAYRSDRDSTRAQQFTYLDAIISSSATTQLAKETAEEMQFNLIDVMEMEVTLEGLIMAKGYEETVVTMGTNNINVIVQDANLVNEDLAKILYVITSETGCSPSKIVIVPYNPA